MALPELMKLRKEFQNKNLSQYLNEHLLKKRELNPLNEDAFETFQKNFSNEVRQISTGSHMAMLQWDEWVGLGENILSNLNHFLNNEQDIVASPCSKITFKNATRPGSINLSNMQHKGIKLNRYTLRGRSKITVNKANPISQREVESFLQPFYKFRDKPDMFSFINQDKLSRFISNVKKMPEMGKTYNQQAGWLSSKLWPHLFNDMQPQLRIKPMEDLKLMRENLLENKKTRELLEQHFQGDYGATSSTYFYYGSCKCGIEFPLEKVEDRGQVYLQGKCLNKNCEYHGSDPYAVDIADIPSEVKRQNLNETLFVSFYNIWAYAGINVMGGFNQIEYIKNFRDKLSEVFRKAGQQKKAEKLKTRPSNLMDAGLITAFNKNGFPKSGSQALFEGGLDKKYIEKFSRLNFAKSVDVSLNTINQLFGANPDHSETLKKLKQNNMEFMIK